MCLTANRKKIEREKMENRKKQRVKETGAVCTFISRRIQGDEKNTFDVSQMVFFHLPWQRIQELFLPIFCFVGGFFFRSEIVSLHWLPIR